MKLDPHQVTALEEFSGKIAAELVFAEAGKDEGLIPAYSLLGELMDQIDSCDEVMKAAKAMQALLGEHLDQGKPWETATINRLTAFNCWCEALHAATETGEKCKPFDQYVADAEAAAAADAAAVAAPSAKPSNPRAETPAPQPVGTIPPELLELDRIQTIDLSENAELLGEFHIEAVDHLGQIEAAVLQLEGDPGNRDAINSVFRSFHTLKGVAGFLHLKPINRLAHEIESVLDDVRTDKLEFHQGITDVVLAGRDLIEKLVAQVGDVIHANRQPDTAIPVSQLIVRVRAVAKRETAAASPAAAEAPVAPVATPSAPAPVATTEAAVVPAPEAPTKVAAPAPQTGNSAGATAASRQESNTIRVQTGKLDSLMDLVGELVIAQSQLVEGAREAGNGSGTLHRTVGHLARISKELQHTAMSLRMIPIKPTFQKMARLVRDLAVTAGKQVSFEMHGEDTELDRNMVEELGDPLVHMIRNGLDHGLEPPAERVAAGKSDTGHIRLSAYHQGGNIVVELKDDGRGINPEKVFKKAVEKGLVNPNQRLTDEEIFKLIFLPGFSTAEKITDISGRGVGMDVVKRNIERLRGSVEIHSELGKGSTFRIMLPLTMAIIDGLIVRVGQDRFILPTTSVQVALRPQADMLATIQGRSEVIVVRGKTIPVVRLHRRLAIESDVTNLVDGTVVILENAGRPCGLFVDEMVSKQEVVVKSLGSTMRNIPGISGGAILGDGSIALILDPASLIKAA
ncbi:MAG: chemotaxis protein CheA [Opitutaceae bacterium]|nr:chemotaxis protein CheA [Opitutaceae bacterium]